VAFRQAVFGRRGDVHHQVNAHAIRNSDALARPDEPFAGSIEQPTTWPHLVWVSSLPHPLARFLFGYEPTSYDLL
jgi:hypothetical protein